MTKVVEFARAMIYCSPAEDRQFRYSLVRTTDPKYPAVKWGLLRDRNRIRLPNDKDRFHLYAIGAVPPPLLNLGKNMPSCMCHKTKWIRVEDDMNERQFIFQIYDDNGVNFPRGEAYYQILRDGSLVFALKETLNTKRMFQVADFKYLRVYSNAYNNESVAQLRIRIKGQYVSNRTELINLQREFTKIDAKLGKTMYFVNGYLVDRLNMSMKGLNYVECFYDATLNAPETFKVRNLRTFMSEIDKRMKYFVHRNRQSQWIQYEDDLEIYVMSTNKAKEKLGVYFYQNQSFSLRNVTDKDYSLDTTHVNNQAKYIANHTENRETEAEITIYTRRQGFERGLIYNATKLHELYKLPSDIEFNVMSSGSYTINDFRVETLEASDYFKVAGMVNTLELTKELAMDAIGYSSVLRYFGDTPMPYSGTHVNVPWLYKAPCTVYEYDSKGIMLEAHITDNEHYTANNKKTAMLEFLLGQPSNEFRLYKFGEKIPYDKDREHIVIGAFHEGDKRLRDWEDLTNDPILKKHADHYEITSDRMTGFRIRYMDDPYLYSINLKVHQEFQLIPLLVDDWVKDLKTTKPLDVFYDTVEVFLNGHRLTYGLDWFMDFPTIGICNKRYIDPSKLVQRIHVRCNGINLKKDGANGREVKGFVNHGVVSRNGYYDIRDDRTFSAYVDGRLQARDSLRYAEEDNTVRTKHPLNGVPYTYADRIVPLLRATELPTMPYFEKDQAKNKRISTLFNEVYPEKPINQFNVREDNHYLFSPVVSKILRDMLDGSLSSEIYTKVYQDSDIRALLDGRYAMYTRLDPVVNDVPKKHVEVHPDYGDMIISVNIYQLRFIQNVIRIITKGDINRINISGYINVNQDAEPINPDTVFDPTVSQ